MEVYLVNHNGIEFVGNIPEKKRKYNKLINILFHYCFYCSVAVGERNLRQDMQNIFLTCTLFTFLALKRYRYEATSVIRQLGKKKMSSI